MFCQWNFFVKHAVFEKNDADFPKQIFSMINVTFSHQISINHQKIITFCVRTFVVWFTALEKNEVECLQTHVIQLRLSCEVHK